MADTTEAMNTPPKAGQPPPGDDSTQTPAAEFPKETHKLVIRERTDRSASRKMKKRRRQ